MNRVLEPGAKVFIDIHNQAAWVSEAFENLNHTFAIVEEVKRPPHNRWAREHEHAKVLVKLDGIKKINSISVSAKFHFDERDLVVMPK